MNEQVGRRIEGGALAVMNGEPGDYCPVYVEGDEESGIFALWFKLPGTGSMGRLPAAAHPAHKPGDEPAWQITEDSEGRVTVEPSIRQMAMPQANPPIPEWHGFLRAGVWSW